jgi:hypothetical protein
MARMRSSLGWGRDRGNPSAAPEPARVLLYGGNVDFDFGATELIEYEAGGFHGR